MSRLGKLPIELPAGVSAKLDGDFIVVKGPKIELKEKANPLVKVEIKDNQVFVTVLDSENKKQKALWGLFRNLVKNMVIGVTNGFEKKLQINGVGYRAQVSGRKIILNVGFSHPVEFLLPNGVEAKVEENVITLNSADKKLLGETAYQIRKVKQPEPYQGKGIKYLEEVIRRKEGKVAAAKSE